MTRAFTVESLADRWECSEGTIRNLIRTGQLGCFRPGNLIRISPEEVARFESTGFSGSRGDSSSSGETTAESATVTGFRPPTALERKLKHGLFGREGTVLPGRWAGS